MNKQSEQKEIKNWFNNTYSRRGEWYLRPVKAYLVFLELLQAEKGKKLLDVACGLGRLLEAAKQYGCELHGIDLSDVAVGKAKSKLPEATIKEANAEDIPYQDQTFDYITCLGSLERMIDLPKVLAELYRVGTDGAQYCFLVRNSNTPSWKYLKKGLGLKNEKGHQGANSLEGWTDIFDAAGMEVDEVWPDQYPIFKRQKLYSLGLRKIDYRRALKEDKPIKTTNEFLFILSKK